METDTECCYRSSNAESVIAANSFWIEGVAVILIGLPGILGNLLSIIVLSMRSMRNVFHNLLVILAVVDLVLVGLSILDYSIVRGFDLHINWYYQAFPFFIYPTTNMVLTASIFLVVAIAYERYIAVCNPYDYRAIVNTQSTRRRVTKLVTPVVLATIIINIPKFFETYTVELPESMHEEGNETIYSYNVTSLRRDSSYITIYVNWFLLITTGLLPMGALIFLNGRIYAKILETRKLRERCRIKATNNIPLVLKKTNQTTDNPIEDNDEGIAPVAVAEMASVANQANSTTIQEASSLQPQNNPASKRHEAMSTKDFKMARVLLSIVLVFFVCHLPRVTLNIIEMMMASKVNKCGENFCPPMLLMCAVPFTHLMLVLNSSANIVIYCLLGDGFRAGLKQSLRKTGKDGGTSVAAKTFARLTQSPSRPRTTDRRELLQVPKQGVTANDLEQEMTMVTTFDMNNSRTNSNTNLREEVNVEMVEIVIQKKQEEEEN